MYIYQSLFAESHKKKNIESVFSNDAVMANSEYRKLYEILWGDFQNKEKKLSYYRISYIFNIMKVRNDELADILYIDKTLVSKWRNGKRKLQNYDDNLYHIVSELYHSSAQNRQIIQSINSAYSELIDFTDETDDIIRFCSWLTYREEENKDPRPIQADSARVYYLCYLGFSGIRDSVRALLHYCKQKRLPFTIYISCFENMEYLYCLGGMLLEFLVEYRQCKIHLNIGEVFSISKLNSYLQRGSKYGRYGDILLDLFLEGNLTVQFSNCPLMDRKTIITVPEMVSLIVTHEDGLPDGVYVRAFYNEKPISKLCSDSLMPVSIQRGVL